MNTHPRRPAAFPLDHSSVIVAERDPEPGTIGAISEIDDAALPATIEIPGSTRRFPWATLLWSALGGLATLGLGLAVLRLTEDLFARSQPLGWLSLSLAALATLALLAIGAREVRSLLQLRQIDYLRERATATIVSDDRAEGIATAKELLHLTRRMPSLARARKTLEAQLEDIIDGADMIRLAERSLMGPLDQEAKRLVTAAAKRVSIVTAVSPRAAVDVLFVAITAFGLTRRLAYLYGARPGSLGLVRLMRLCIAHLTLTGGLAVSDGLVSQMLGHGVVAKLSTRLGEGVLNGLLTARLGLAAIEVTRPLQFVALSRPSLGELAGDLLRQRERVE
ncbi:MAG: YcjF family protein [Xanthobacteraceae bacterium]